MLTVLHRGPDGSERIFEAEGVTRYPPQGEQSVPPMGEIVAHGVVGQPSETITLGIFGPFGAVFVMNRFGQTVARYNYPHNGTVAKAI